MNNNSEKVDMLFTYWECQKNTRLAKETYALRYPSNYDLTINLIFSA
jgi:hypothetical protein